MKRFYIKQKIFSMSEKFTVFDEQQQPAYEVAGSFLCIPKSFTIYNQERKKVAVVTKKTMSFLPKFLIKVNRREKLMIKKTFSLFKARYTIDGEGIEVRGDWWDMDFEVIKDGQIIGSVQKEWLRWGDSYEVRVQDETLEELLIAITVAIDCVKADESDGTGTGD